MSNLYVRVFTNFYTHRKTLRLRGTLGNDALWIPPRLWAYAADNQPDGIFKDYSPEEIALLLNYTGDASKMLQALLQAGFMDDEPLRIHGWDESNQYHKTYADRAKKAAAARWNKSLSPHPSSTEMDTGEGKGSKHTFEHASSIPLSELSVTEKIAHEGELGRCTDELRELGKLSDHDKGSKKHTRIGVLKKRVDELRMILGVVA